MRVVIAEDSVLLREGLARLLNEAGFEVTAQAENAEELLELVARHQPDIAIVDIRMPPGFTTEGLRAANEIRRDHPGVSVLVLSQYIEAGYAVKLITASEKGVGYLLKDRILDLKDFVEAVEEVAAGGSVIDPEVVTRLLERKRGRNPLDTLSERERQVLQLMAEGRSNKAIGTRLFLTEKTVESHVRSIFTKLDLLPAPEDHRRVLAVLSHLRGE